MKKKGAPAPKRKDYRGKGFIIRLMDPERALLDRALAKLLREDHRAPARFKPTLTSIIVEGALANARQILGHQEPWELSISKFEWWCEACDKAIKPETEFLVHPSGQIANHPACYNEGGKL